MRYWIAISIASLITTTAAFAQDGLADHKLALQISDNNPQKMTTSKLSIVLASFTLVAGTANAALVSVTYNFDGVDSGPSSTIGDITGSSHSNGSFTGGTGSQTAVCLATMLKLTVQYLWKSSCEATLPSSPRLPLSSAPAILLC